MSDLDWSDPRKDPHRAGRDILLWLFPQAAPVSLMPRTPPLEGTTLCFLGGLPGSLPVMAVLSFSAAAWRRGDGRAPDLWWATHVVGVA